MKNSFSINLWRIGFFFQEENLIIKIIYFLLRTPEIVDLN